MPGRTYFALVKRRTVGRKIRQPVPNIDMPDDFDIKWHDSKIGIELLSNLRRLAPFDNLEV